ncbi:type III pantothenate kinase [Alteromonas facilis]|uniref:type III pantothenate kinase n=1 Tax=Alteromonas facilis TaxID=2048004 RepID=UPI000C289B4F|nr:type III pantothenate kinase [Alteromonas facilis]
MRNEYWLFDIGNTQCKLLRICRDGSDMLTNIDTDPVKFTDHLELQAFVAQYTSTKDIDAFVASVRSDEETQRFIDAMQTLARSVEHIHTQAETFGLHNSYSQPNKMGVDRWLAMIGSQLLTDKPFIVVDAGTAVTIDAVAENKHLGGWIAPGYQLGLNAVTGNTRRVYQRAFTETDVVFGNDTEACLHYGELAQLNGMIWMACDLMGKKSPDFDIIIAGGDQHLFEQMDSLLHNKSFLRARNIVFLGLIRFLLAKEPLETQRKCVESLDI